MAPPKRPWFRFYSEAVHDRKLRRERPETRWLFVACLCAARQSPVPGVLLVGPGDPMRVVDLVDLAAMSEKAVRDGMAALCAAGVLAFDDESGAWAVPKWAERQFESDDVTTRVQRFRERRSNVSLTADVTPPENRDRYVSNSPGASSNGGHHPQGIHKGPEDKRSAAQEARFARNAERLAQPVEAIHGEAATELARQARATAAAARRQAIDGAIDE